MVRFNWNDLDPLKDFNDGSPNQGLIWGSLWAQNRAWRIEQELWLLGTETAGITSSTFLNMDTITTGASGRVQEKVQIPRETEEISPIFFARGTGAGGSTSTIKLRCTLFLDASNEWPLYFADDDTQRGKERTEMESDALGPFDIGAVSDYNSASYEGPGLSTDVLGVNKDTDPDTVTSVDTIASFLPAEFELRFDVLRFSGTGTMFVQLRALLLQQKGAFYQDTRQDTLFIP